MKTVACSDQLSAERPVSLARADIPRLRYALALIVGVLVPPVRLMSADPVSTGVRGVTDRQGVVNLAEISVSGARAEANRSRRVGLHSEFLQTAWFPAHVQTNGIAMRPDATGAVGKDHVVSITWDGIRVHLRDGTLVHEASVADFWGPIGPFEAVSPGSCDTNLYTFVNPQVRYDPIGGRWMASVGASLGSAEASLLLAVSASEHPGRDWRLHRIRADASRRETFELPNLGFGPRWIVIQSGISLGYTFGSQSFGGSRIWVFDKAALYAGTDEGRFTVFKRTDLNYSQWVVSNYDENDPVMYLVGLGNDLGNEARNGLRLYTISGQIGYEVFGLGPTITTTQQWRNIPSGGFNANTLPQLGTNAMIAPQDSIPLSAMQRDGSIWVAHHIQLPASATRRTSVQWWQIDPRGKVLQRGLIDDPENKVHYAFPSIAANRYGDVVVGFSRFATNQYPSANWAWRLANDPPGELTVWGAPLKEGEAPFVWPNRCVANRTEWGWYSASVYDPIDESLWILQQYAASPENGQSRWGAWWGRLGPFPGLAVDFRAPATVTKTLDGTTRVLGQWPEPWTGPGIPLRVTIANRNAHVVTNVSIALEGLTPSGAYCTAQLDAAYRGLDWLEDLGSDSRYGSRCRINSIAPGEVVAAEWYACDNFLPLDGTVTNVVTVGVGPNQNSDWATTVSTITRILPDADGDDVPDHWETANGLAATDRADADGDLDADGVSNRREHQAGTNPLDPASRPELASISRVAGGTTPGWRLQLRTVAGRFYRLERTDRLVNPQWISVADEIRGVAGTVAVTDPDTRADAPRFYRVLVLP